MLFKVARALNAIGDLVLDTLFETINFLIVKTDLLQVNISAKIILPYHEEVFIT